MCQFSSKKGQAYPIRPHHGMCLAYFIGNGYSSGFTAHMQEMLDIFMRDARVRLVVKTDEICGACPNSQGGSCLTPEKVEKYDRAVLEACGLLEGQEMGFLEFAAEVQKKVISAGMRSEICGDCQWNEICRSQPSRWESITIS